MKRFLESFAIVAAIAAVAITGCNKMTTEPAVTDQQYFLDVISGNDLSTRDIAVSDEEALSDGATFSVATAPLPPHIQSVMDTRIVPQAWGRYITGVTRSITRTTADGDTAQIVRAEISITGTFVIVGTLNGVQDTVKKPFTLALHRLFRFVKVANTKNARLNWRLDAVSIVDGGTANTQISIQKIQVEPSSGDTLTATDPDTYFMQLARGWMHRLPMWGTSTPVTVIATVHSTDVDSDFVMLHYVSRFSGSHRDSMSKISETPNPAGGVDRVYSATLTIPDNGRKFSHIVVSATTSSSLFSADSTQFGSVIWGVPYKVSE